MSEPFRDFDELRRLVDAVCDETISAAQMGRLEAMVLAHPEAEAYYVQYMSQYADLARHFAALPSTTEKSLRGRLEHAPVQPRAWRWLAWSGVAMAAAAALLLALFYPRLPVDDPKPVAEADQERLDNSVALLLRAPGAEWDAFEPPPRVGVPLKPGRLKLRDGCAHIEFYSGATVILQGPAELLLLAHNEAYCAYGKLRATVPPQAQGFRIGSPQLDVVDRGTEFGMDISADEKTEVHVFQGKVELYDAGSGPNATARQELTTGQGVRLEGMGDVSHIRADPTGFSTAADLAERQRRELRRRQEIWSAASEALRRDPSLVVYYSFQTHDQETFARTLPNQALSRHDLHDGVIVGCQWVTGRWPGKLGLDFKQVSDRVRFHVPGEYASLSLACWVRVDALPNRFNSLMMTDGWEAHEPHWHLSDTGQLELGVQGPNKKNGIHYYGPEAVPSDRFGQWAHLAVVYDGDSREVTHYVDGKPLLRQPMKVHLPLRLGDVELGNWNLAAHTGNTSPVRYFTGCMDEFLMFSRALGDEEVERLHGQGKPPQ